MIQEIKFKWLETPRVRVVVCACDPTTQEAEAVGCCQFAACLGQLQFQSQTLFQQTRKAAAKMAQWSRELAGPLEDLALTSSTYMVVCNH